MKTVRYAEKLGVTLEQLNDRHWEFDALVPNGAYWGTRWRGTIDLEDGKVRINQAPTHPHVCRDYLCVDDLPDRELMTLVQALASVWHVQDLEGAWLLDDCIINMVEGLDRDPDAEPDLLAQYKWVKRALKFIAPRTLGVRDVYQIRYYKELIRDIQGRSSESESSEESE
jgi:hypothetical protein